MKVIKRAVKKIYWKLPVRKEWKLFLMKKWVEHKVAQEEIADKETTFQITDDAGHLAAYSKYVLGLYGKRSEAYRRFERHEIESREYSIVAYYLTQFHPNPPNDEWWGKGATEWNNVNQAVPQFEGHYQPRKPGELGYYDLRLKENMRRQIELAGNYGITEFCFYYYWFDGLRLLEKPLDMFLHNEDLEIQFSYCWANENWTRRFSGTDTGALMKIVPTVESYSKFIDAVLGDMKDRRYHRINGMPVLSVYRPGSIPECRRVLKHWQERAREVLGTDLYLIAIRHEEVTEDWTKEGFNAEADFQPGCVKGKCNEITSKMKPVRKDFSGKIYDYRDLVEGQRYVSAIKEGCYPAIMPMWDNTARRNARGVIFHGSTPELYKKWFKYLLRIIDKDRTMDEKRLYINAWNEWGEGAYLEPDYFFGYAYLQATYEAVCEHIDIKS